MLVGSCQLIIEGMLITTDRGVYHLASFVDEQRMCRLYERFILEYYAHTTQVQYDRHTLHSNNLYQIFTYVKNRDYDFGDQRHRVSGMLLYARTEEEIQPDNVYQMHGNQISVKTLDLNQEFPLIAEQLNEIIKAHFE